MPGDTLDVFETHSDLYRSKKDGLRYEIGRIEIVGNEAFPDEMILQYVSQRPTTSGILEDMVIMYMDMVQENGHLGSTYEKLLTETYNDLEIDFGFYSEASTSIDSFSITEFYEIQGRHEAVVEHFFFADTLEEENVLLFRITEGPQYRFDTIVYENLGLIDTNLVRKIQNFRTLTRGMDFNEGDVFEEVIGVKSILQDNGYYTANFDIPDVIRDSINKKDSVIVYMHLGPRVRFGKIQHKHILNSQSKVSNSLVDQMLEFKTGDYYSKSAVNNSESNLLSLQTFELITIDTIHNQQYEYGDTIVPFLVQMAYKPQNEVGLDAGLVQKVEGIEFFNIRGQLNYDNKNLFGAAQNYGANITFDIRDIQRWINSNFDGSTFEWEGQLGLFNYYQPLIAKYGNTRLGLNSTINYSVRNAGNVFEVQTFYLSAKIPIDFADHLWVNNLTIEASLEKQMPKRYEGREATDFRYNFEYFQQASEFNSANEYTPTAFVLSTSLYHDTRNDLFHPTGGWQFSALLDVTPALSLAEYVRFQLNTNNFFDIGWGSVLASKVRLGHIFFLKSDDGNNYISTGKQFFAGGPNSNRGWDPRRLRASLTSADSLGLEDTQYNFFQDFIGNTSVIEMSFEYRYRFHAIKSIPPAYSDFLENLGIVLFTDIGNSYGWLVESNTVTNPLTLGYIFENLAMSGGLGFRYFTPFGPIRVDLAVPIYGPIAQERQWITAVAPFDYLQLNLGLQHAF